MTMLDQIVGATPDWAKTTFAVVGALAVFSKLSGFVRLLLRAFVLPGANVGRPDSPWFF